MQEGERREQRQPVGRLDHVHVEHALERREDERARHQPRDERVEDDEHAPLELDLVRVDEAFDAVAWVSPQRTEPSSPL